MPAQSVVDTVMSRLSTWPRAPAIEQNGMAEPPADGSAYVLVQFVGGDERHIGLGGPGARVYRTTQALRLVLHVPRGQGLATYRPWVDELRALFRATATGALRFHAPSPSAEDDDADRGPYAVLSFAVPYDFDIAA